MRGDPVLGDGIDVESAGYDGDGLLDLYLCNYRQPDRLLLGRLRYENYVPVLR